MKFKINVIVTSPKEGLALLTEYERLEFPENHRNNKLQRFVLGVNVSKEFAKNHHEIFNDIGSVTLEIDSSRTRSSDYEDWGSAGMVLSQDRVTEERIKDWL
jgi:hypothetical protein